MPVKTGEHAQFGRPADFEAQFGRHAPAGLRIPGLGSDLHAVAGFQGAALEVVAYANDPHLPMREAESRVRSHVPETLDNRSCF
jgi:hypothetical protein